MLSLLPLFIIALPLDMFVWYWLFKLDPDLTKISEMQRSLVIATIISSGIGGLIYGFSNNAALAECISRFGISALASFTAYFIYCQLPIGTREKSKPDGEKRKRNE